MVFAASPLKSRELVRERDDARRRRPESFSRQISTAPLILRQCADFARAREQLNFAQGLEKDAVTLARIRSRLDYIRDIENKFYR